MSVHFLFDSIHCLSQEDLPSAARLMASILFKNAVLNNTKDELLEGLWFTVSERDRNEIKEAILFNLDNEDKDVRRGAGFCVAAIASLEIPQGQWLNIIEVLAQQIQHDSRNIRLASLQTLGFICEELETDEEKIEETTKDIIISGLLNGVE